MPDPAQPHSPPADRPSPGSTPRSGPSLVEAMDSGPSRVRYALILTCILLVATVVRAWDLGRLSLWYDEVATMRLARTSNPEELVHLLRQIDATRAPLHPLLLQSWIRLLGSSEASGRALSVLCGVLTVGLVCWIGRLAYDRSTGLWAAWLCTLSPSLVQYAREVRMYALLALLTCLAWGLLLSFRESATRAKITAYALTLIALVYCHPLGFFMLAALGVGYAINQRELKLSWRQWLGCHLLLGLAVAPWIANYLDHAPETLVGRPSLRLLLGLPIGFTGGNSITLLGFAALILLGIVGVGWVEHRPRVQTRLDHALGARALLAWFLVPPILLYAVSWVGPPIFGLARYNLYVGPAYLLLLARGIVKLSPVLRGAVALGITACSLALLQSSVFAPDQKADWRGAARFLAPYSSRSGGRVTVIVLSADAGRNLEVETSRYYLGTIARAITPEEAREELSAAGPIDEAFFAVGTRHGHAVARIPSDLAQRYPATTAVIDLPGLRLMQAAPAGPTE